ncbi:MAG: hypothetical protein Q9160_008897 [Pyrenula sp. 1 TL-2023]
METTANELIRLAVNRRSNYALNADSTISEQRIREIMEAALTQVPSAFGSYTTRLVVLLKDEHRKLWDLTLEIFEKVMSGEMFVTRVKPRVARFRKAYGTVLFFEAPEMIKKLQEQFPQFTDHFPQWSNHTSAMHQYFIWTALASEGMGASLQHMNPAIDERVKAEWKLAEDWTLIAQLVFGNPTSEPQPKPTQNMKPMNERLFFHG